MTSIATVQEAAKDYVAGLEPSRMSTSDAALELRRVSRAKSMLATAEARLAARAAESPAWQKEGAKSAAENLARTTGISVGQARTTLQTGQRIEELPEVLSAANSGRLSFAQLVPVAEAAYADPQKAKALVELADSTPLGPLKEACLRVKLAGEDPEARRAKISAERYLRTWAAGDGGEILQAKDNAEVIAKVKASLVEERERIFQANRKAGVHASPEALDWDALLAKVTREPDANVAPVRRTRRRGPQEMTLIRVDLPTLFRGRPVDGEVCEIVGHGPIAVSAVTDGIESGSAFVAAVLTRAEQVLGVLRFGRKPTAADETALMWLSPTCTNIECQTPYDLELDHVFGHEWASSKTTGFDFLAPLCGHDHDLKTYKGWALVEGTGKRAFVPPDDLRHPKNQERPPP